MKKLIIISLFCMLSSALWAQQNWKSISSADDLCKAYPKLVKEMFENLDLNKPALSEVKKAYEQNNLTKACDELLKYYGQSSDIRPASQLPAPSGKKVAAAEDVLKNINDYQEVKGVVPTLPNGHLDWEYRGPKEDQEWAWGLNRHGMIGKMIAAYNTTGNIAYVKYIDQFMKDWVISSLPYPGVRSNTGKWRGLEVALRLPIWSDVFYSLWNTNEISPATRVLILCSLPHHAHYIRNFHAQGNWLTMEIRGLATIASYWPELKQSKEWMDYGMKTMYASMQEQVYPDGAQMELTTHYHKVAMSMFEAFADIYNRNKSDNIPQDYKQTIVNMWNYLTFVMRPNGTALLNNDGDLDNNRDQVLAAAAKYNKPEWAYVASNGKEGTKPQSGPSNMFPWAGHLISRSGYDADAHWSMFDMGPWGIGHQHNDKMHISVAAYGRDLLVDGGRFAYRGEVADRFRTYCLGSSSHNVILVDGKGQADAPLKVDEPIDAKNYATTKDYDFGSTGYDKFNIEGKFSHNRSLLYIRDKFWVVVDRVKTDSPRKIQTLWHWHPECKVAQGKNGVIYSQNSRGNLQVIPVGIENISTSLVKGVEQQPNNVQGWYSKSYNQYAPNFTAICETKVDNAATQVWILYPYEKSAPNVTAKIVKQDAGSVTVLISENGKDSYSCQIPFENKDGLTVKNL